MNMDPKCEIVEMTPEMAKTMLESNTHNRRLRKAYVQQLAGAIERGEWVANGEPVQVASDGTLLNGQHRLSAVVEAGLSVPLLLVRGLPETARRTIDTGTRRNLSDVLALHGEHHTTNLGAALSLLYRYRAGQRLDQASRTAPTPQQALELLEREPQIRDALMVGHKVHRATRMRISATAVLLHLFEEADPGQGEAFFEAVCHPTNEPRRSPVMALRSLLERSRADPKHRISTYSLCAVTIKAFNGWREGRGIDVLAFKPLNKEPFPEIKPPVEKNSTT